MRRDAHGLCSEPGNSAHWTSAQLRTNCTFSILKLCQERFIRPISWQFLQAASQPVVGKVWKRSCTPFKTNRMTGGSTGICTQHPVPDAGSEDPSSPNLLPRDALQAPHPSGHSICQSLPHQSVQNTEVQQPHCCSPELCGHQQLFPAGIPSAAWGSELC